MQRRRSENCHFGGGGGGKGGGEVWEGLRMKEVRIVKRVRGIREIV